MAIENVNTLLKKWGKFHRDGGGELGFPTCSPESRAGEGAGGKQVGDGYVPADVERIEQAVLAMDVESRAVAKEFYMTGYPSDVVAKRLTVELGKNISRRGLYERVDRLHHFVNGYLISLE